MYSAQVQSRHASIRSMTEKTAKDDESWQNTVEFGERRPKSIKVGRNSEDSQRRRRTANATYFVLGVPHLL